MSEFDIIQNSESRGRQSTYCLPRAVLIRAALGRQNLISAKVQWDVVNFLDTRVRIRHPCPFCDFSDEFPDAEIVQWCNGSNEILQVTTKDAEDLEKIMSKAEKSLSARQLVQDGGTSAALLLPCRCHTYRSISSIAEDCGVWTVPPVFYDHGHETYRVLSQGKASLQKFVSEVRKCGTVEIQSHQPREQLDVVRDLSVVPVHFFGGLTELQVHALVLAFENGLLEIPAKMKMDTVAKGEGVSRSTFGEHLRKAQLQLIRNSYPFLKLRDAAKKH